MKSDSKDTRYGFCMGNRAGWKSIRARLEKFLPEVTGDEWAFVHPEDQCHLLGEFSRSLGKFQMIYDAMAGRAAVSEAIRRGAKKIILATYHNCPWLPVKKGVRYFIFFDATMYQLVNLGYNGPAKDVSRLARLLYGHGLKRQAAAGQHFFCMSTWCADGLKAKHPVADHQITIIPPMVDTQYWIPREGGRLPGPLRVVFIGADFLRKGGDVLMEVANQPEFRDVEWHLVTKSPPVTDLPNIKSYTGFDADADGLRNLVRACDVLVLPTKADCSPIVVLEAAASGIPSIATSMAGIVDLIDDRVSGRLIDRPDAACLAGALEEYRSSPELLESHGRAAREKIVREFDARVVVAKIREAMDRTD